MLSPLAEKMIDQYFNLPFPGIQGVRCPYFNNLRKRSRGQLRALIGKGTPEEIVDESKIISTQYRLGIFENNCAECKKNLTPDDIRKFMIDNDLGIECSGFITQILREHFRETKGIDFNRKIFICQPKKILRYLISKLRPIENINVKILADDRNSAVVPLKEAQPGDIITMLDTNPKQNRNHVLLIRDVNADKISYVHARAWTSEGKYGHGVMNGTIEIVNPEKNLLAQRWLEKDHDDDKNETLAEAKKALTLEIRRLKI